MAAVGLLGNVLRQDQENKDLLAAKAKLLKDTRPRAALGDLANDIVLATKPAANKTFSKRKLLKSEETTGFFSKQQTKDKSSAKPIDLCTVSSALETSVAAFPSNVEDIDKDDYGNPQLCAEYAREIYQYMHKLECEFHVPPKYMSQMTEVNERMRAILVDWLVQVHLRFRLLLETLYMTVSIMDRFLSVYDVTKNNLQLVGVTCMLLASKYEEMYPPEIGDFVYITDNAYTKDEIRKMEGIIFRHLSYSVGKPFCLQFLRRNSKAGEVDAKKHTMAKYFMELTLGDYECVKFTSSEIAAAALYIAISADGDSEWTPTLEFYSMYSESKLQPCARRIAHLITRTTNANAKLKAVYSKYSSSKFMQVSTLPCLRSSFVTNLAAEARH